MENENIDEIMAECAKEAVDFAKKQFNIDLDYSEASIDDVETILSSLYDSIPKGWWTKLLGKCPTKQQINGMSVIWGGYIGEVFKRVLGGGVVPGRRDGLSGRDYFKNWCGSSYSFW